MTNLPPGTRPDLDHRPEARRRRRIGWVAFGVGVVFDAAGILLLVLGFLGSPWWFILGGIFLGMAGTAGVIWGLYEFYRTLTRGNPVLPPATEAPDGL